MASDLVPGGLNVGIFTSFIYMLHLSDLVFTCAFKFFLLIRVFQPFLSRMKASLTNSMHKYRKSEQ